MGLDMYLTKRTDVKNWNFTKAPEKHAVTVKKGGKKHSHIQPKRIKGIIEDVGYWRKANHIHQWFVNHVQSGTDDCGEYNVSKEQLIELRDTCQKTVDLFDNNKSGTGDNITYNVDESILKELLPTTTGFFFGGVEYDQWYYQDTKDTIKIIDDCFKGCDGEGNTIGWDIEIYYRSCW